MLQIILSIFLFVLFVTYYVLKKKLDFWKDKGVPCDVPHFIFGGFRDVLMQKKNFSDIVLEQYRKYSDCNYFGFWRLRSPTLIVRDTNIIKNILTTDFNKFQKNDFQVNKDVDKLSGNNPFFLSGDQWKKSRSHFTYTLTTSKIKNYYNDMTKVAHNMVDYINDEIVYEGSADFDAKQLFGKYTTDVVANAIFGIKNNTFAKSENAFYKVTQSLFDESLLTNIRLTLSLYFPSWVNFLKIRLFSKTTEDFVINTTKAILDYRTKDHTNRQDFFHQMLEFRNNDRVNEFTDEYIASHAFGFVLDGYETSSNVISMAICELAWNKEVQEKLRGEISERLKETNGLLNYDQVINMKYLDMVFSETLRLHPPVAAISKRCTADKYMLPSQNNKDPVVLENDAVVILPILALHRDPKYFEEPDKFWPERFENGSDQYKYCYLPFGDGPRTCVGMRYGIAQSKLAIAEIIRHFHVEPQPSAMYPIKYNPKSFLLVPENGLITFKKIK